MLAFLKKNIRCFWSFATGPYILLGLLGFALVFGPILIKRRLFTDEILDWTFLAILIVGAFTVSRNIAFRIFAITVAFLASISRLAFHIHPTEAISISNNLLSALTLGIFIYLMIRRFFNEKTLVRHQLVAAITIYLLIGFLWARLYELTYVIDPQAFSKLDEDFRFSLIYFSFVTLTTIGYGDILALSLMARNLVIIEGLLGQLYLVITISTLASQMSKNAINQATQKIMDKKD